MLTHDYTAIIAPSTAICADCGCSAAGDICIRTLEKDPLCEHPVATYRHVSATGCLVARRRSEAFWYGTEKEGAE